VKDEKTQELIEAIEALNSDICEAITNLNGCISDQTREIESIAISLNQISKR